MRAILILLFGLKLTDAVIHSHEYIYTATSGIADFPEFVIVGMLDGQQINYFDSQTMKMVPRTDWVGGAVDPDFWNRNGQIASGTHQTFKNNIEVAKQRFNQTGGVHTFQFMYGCELDDEGSIQAHYQYGFDGDDFISFDKNTLTWTAANPQAVISKNKWEADRAIGEQRKGYLENTCTEWLKKYLGYGKDTLERKVSPQVSLLQKDPSSPVSCHATGFYPSGVKISWQKNRQDHYEDVDLGELLPNEDGTFQRTSTLRVTPDEWKTNVFTCMVEHQGKTIQSILTEDKIRTSYASVPIAIIVAVVAAIILLAVIGIAGYVVYKKKHGFKPVRAADDSSNSSGHS